MTLSAAYSKLLFVLLVINVPSVTSKQGDHPTLGDNGEATTTTDLPAPDVNRPKGSRRAELPPLPSDSGIRNQSNRPRSNRTQSELQTRAPSNIPLPGNHRTVPPPVEPIQSPIFIEEGYFCESTPPIPLPEPVNCPTCFGQCGSTSCPNDMCETVRLCSCDHLCSFFNDCCDGFEENCPVEYTKAIKIKGELKNVKPAMLECFSTRQPHQGSTAQMAIPMVTKCFDGTECPRADRKWDLLPNLNEYIPVMDPVTGLQFFSYECANCNGIVDVIPWNASIDMNKGPRLEAHGFKIPMRDFSNVTSIKYRQDFDVLPRIAPFWGLHNIGVSLQPPDGVSMRRCPTYPIIDTCSDSCNQNKELVDLCTNSSAIYSIIDFIHDKAYRNFYCALCAWRENMGTIAQPSFQSKLVCGANKVLQSSIAMLFGSLVLDIQMQFDTERGLFLPNKTMDYCAAKPENLMPEPTGCPTCQGRCGTATKLFPDQNRQFCSCDSYCLFYNDCCDRFALYCPDEWEEGTTILRNLSQYTGAHPQCFPTRINATSLEVMMVHTCPNDEETFCTDVLNYHDLRRFYLRENIEEYVPVTDVATGIKFASAQCARCNNVSDFVLWKVKVNINEYSLYDLGIDPKSQNQLDLEAQLPILRNLSIIPVVTFSPPPGTIVRHCYRGYSGTVPKITVRDTCPDSCQNEQLRDMCENGNTFYSKYRYKPLPEIFPQWKMDDPTFKNFHCALCNWDRTSQQLYGDTTGQQIVCGAVGESGIQGGPNLVGSVSLTLVFDFNVQRGRQVGHKESGETSVRETDDTKLEVLGIITIVCMCISIVCLLIRIGFQGCVPHFWSFAGRLQVQLAVALLIAFISLLIGAFVEEQHQLCYFCAVLKNFGFLATFSWMTTISFATWKVFGSNSIKNKSKTSKQSLPKISIPAWLVPIVLTAFTIMIDFIVDDNSFSPSFAQPLCWYNQRHALLIYFGIPIALCLIVNTILFILTAIQLRKAFRNSKAVSKQEQKYFQVYVRLFLLMGITWILGFIAPFIDHVVVQSLFVILNALQGLFLFIAFVCQKKVWDYLTMKTPKDTSTLVSSTGSSSGSQAKYKTTTTNVKSDVKRKSNVDSTNL